MVEPIIKDVKEIEAEISKEAREVKIRVVLALLIFIFLVLFGGFVYSQIEYYPGTLERWTYLDGIYFSTMTLTTVGYGDLSPHSDTGKIFTIFYAFFGIAMAFYVLFIVGRYLMHYNVIFFKRGRRLAFPRLRKKKKT